jgi:hypothetical protein
MTLWILVPLFGKWYNTNTQKRKDLCFQGKLFLRDTGLQASLFFFFFFFFLNGIKKKKKKIKLFKYAINKDCILNYASKISLAPSKKV